jgi:hypothetical protein
MQWENLFYHGWTQMNTDREKDYETSEKRPFIVAAVGRPPHFSSKLKSAALCREAATLVLQRSHYSNANEFTNQRGRPGSLKQHFALS